MQPVDKTQDDATWYKDAIIYEIHVKAFHDSAQDGIGDFLGLTAKLDYLRDLGVTAVWLLPFYPSPLRDDGYDISDYYRVYRPYGDLSQFKVFLSEAHKRGIKVITELVINHTSDRHEWFLRARRAAPGTNERDFYVWTDDPHRYSDARVIFKDTEASNWTWDPVAKAYYWHRFYSHQPDLNFDNPEVQKAVFDVMDFWLKLGVDGLRLDAVPYLFEREGTNCENLPETHGFLKKLRAHMDSRFRGRMLLAEANQWPGDAASYFGDGDECNMAFHFPLMPRMFMAVQMEDRFPIVDILEETPEIPSGCQWGIFLRNHDELTLEMVTDEERDYMYRVYAHDKQARINLGIRRRLAPLLGNDRRKIELMNVLLFTLPGTPVIYYGDEIGMGDNIYLGDRNGVRTPMQWSADLNAGFSRTNPQKLYLPVIIEPKFHYEVVNVENQEGDPASLLWWLRKLIFLRKQFSAFGRGTIEFLPGGSEKVIAFVRRYEKENLLVVANLSRKPQSVDLDLPDFNGYSPTEIVGGNPFPDVGRSPYRMTLGAHGYFIFSLVKKEAQQKAAPEQVPQLIFSRDPGEVFEGRMKGLLESALLPPHLLSSRWFGGKARRIEKVTITDVVEPKDKAWGTEFNLILEVEYAEGLAENYFLPLAYISDEELAATPEASRPRAMARVQSPLGTGSLCEVSSVARYGASEMQALANQKIMRGKRGNIVHLPAAEFRKLFPPPYQGQWDVRALGAEQSNSSFVSGEKAIIKLMRKVEEGAQPEVEIGHFLTRRNFPSTPAFLGHVEYQREEAEPMVLAIAQAFVRNEGDAWKLFTREFEGFAEGVAHGQHDALLDSLASEEPLLVLARTKNLSRLFEATSPLFAENVRSLGKRTAEFHIALASDPDDPDFAPEPFGYLSLTSVAQSMINSAHRAFQLASKAKLADPEQARALQEVLASKDRVIKVFENLRGLKVDSLKCRIHGDYHLGQVLYTGKDFVIVDYEGKLARPIGERRLKRSPLRDVAGMIRSFHYVAVSTLIRDRGAKQYASHHRMGDSARTWYRAVASEYLSSYLGALGGTRLAPSDDQVLGPMLDAYILEKALYELGYELNSRPDWAGIPIQGIRETLGMKTTGAEMSSGR